MNKVAHENGGEDDTITVLMMMNTEEMLAEYDEDEYMIL